jgi:hypothetical protein
MSQHPVNPPFDRRQWLGHVGCGFAALANHCLQTPAVAAAADRSVDHQRPHHPASAKRIIFLFMQGGVSQVDSFDYKPLLNSRAGEVLTFQDARQLAKIGRPTEQRLLASPWQFQQHGECGQWVSELFPALATQVDKLCFLHAVHTEGVAHGPATLFLHCGATQFVRPSMGSWILYGLGPQTNDLPGFVSIGPSMGNGGTRNFGQAFLPAIYQGTPVGAWGQDALSIRNLQTCRTATRETSRRELLRDLNHFQRQGRPDDELWAASQADELAWRMQTVTPALLDLSTETAATLQHYGIEQPHTQSFGRRCLLARRLCEAGVRFIQVTYGDDSANPAWDQHSNLPKHADHAAAVDRPIAALLYDLEQRGLLEDTIVWWGSEFGRTPYAENHGTGRDHNPNGFTMWMAGGGFQPGLAHGQTDEFGFRGVAGRVHLHDLHATLLHQMGLDHTKLTYRHAGRDFRLTDVHGRVIHEIIR